MSSKNARRRGTMTACGWELTCVSLRIVVQCEHVTWFEDGSVHMPQSIPLVYWPGLLKRTSLLIFGPKAERMSCAENQAIDPAFREAMGKVFGTGGLDAGQKGDQQ